MTKQDRDIDAIEMLEAQHRQAEELFARLAERPPQAELGRLFDELADLLAIHATIEERHFYPAVRTEETDEQLQRSVEEHLAVKRVLATLLANPPSSDGASFDELEELEGLTDEHVIEEEQELFPKVRELIDAEQLVMIAQEMMATMAELQREGQPRAHVLGETGEPAPL